MKKKLHSLLPALFFFILLNTSLAQPPNDSCTAAIEVFMTDVVDFTTLNATSGGPFHPDSPCPSSASDSIFSDIWYVHTAVITGELLWTLCGMADFDSRIAVYKAGASCPLKDGDLLDCNEDGPAQCINFESELRFNVVQGETYMMRLGGFGSEEPGAQGSGSFSLDVPPSGPPNDDCANAIPITLGEDQPVTNISATTDGPDHPNDQICFGFGDITAQNDVWFSFTAPVTGLIEWSTCGQVNWDSRLVVYGPNVDCATASPDNTIGCSDATGGCANFTNILDFEVEKDSTYLMRIGGFGGDSGVGVFDLTEITPPEPPANDLCGLPDTAWVITLDEADNFDVIFEGNTTNSTISEGVVDPACGTGQGGEFPDIWYKFNTLGNEQLEVRFLGTTDGAGFFWELFDACGVPVDTNIILNSCIRFNPDDPIAIDTIMNLPPEPTEFFIRVASWIFWPPGEFFFQIVGDVVTATAEPNFPGHTSLFPNPATDRLQLNLSLDGNAATEVQIVNMLGQNLLKVEPGNLPAGEHHFEFDTGQFPQGIYFLILRANGLERGLKFIKE